MSERLLEVSGLSKRFGGVAALRNVDGHSVAGETLGMIGPNGSGKTTFVNMVSGHVKPDSGTLLFAGHDIAGKTPHELAAIGLCRTYQAVRVFSALSTRQNIDTARLLPVAYVAKAKSQQLFTAKVPSCSTLQLMQKS